MSVYITHSKDFLQTSKSKRFYWNVLNLLLNAYLYIKCYVYIHFYSFCFLKILSTYISEMVC